jgi:hypothetical protein
MTAPGQRNPIEEADPNWYDWWLMLRATFSVIVIQ